MEDKSDKFPYRYSSLPNRKAKIPVTKALTRATTI
jgi:hypothetical protein